MVDTINPQTGQSDNFEQSTSQPVGQPNPSNFYAGFGKPEDVHVNLAGSDSQVRLVPAPVEEQPKPADSIQPTFTAPSQNSQAQPEKHQAYSNHKTPINFRLLLFMGLIGLISIMLVGGTTYFIASSGNQKKIETEKEALSDLQSQLDGLKANPDRLELPVSEPAPVTNTETPAAPPVEEKPIETPATSPSTEPDGMG